MRGAISPLRQYAFMAWCLVKHSDVTLTYLYLSKYEELLQLPFKTQRVVTPSTKYIVTAYKVNRV
jgi:hypothetical protein